MDTQGTSYERQWAGASRIKLIVALTHPKAVLIFSSATILLALVAGQGEVRLGSIIQLTLAMAAAQAAIGIINEVCDYDLDSAAKPWRTLPAGLISLRSATIWAVVVACISVLTASLISIKSMLLLVVGMGSGILYSIKLKRTVFSWVPYAIAYPLPPVWIWVSLDKFNPGILNFYLIALPFFLSIHLCNQLRDFDEDASMDMRGLVHYLGKKSSIILCFVLLVMGPGLLLVFNDQHWQRLLILSCIILHWVLILPCVLSYIKNPSTSIFRTLFRRLQITGPLMYVGWLLITQMS
jgi:4-hydroxybenzoate polyprenyltransferase